MVCGSMWLLFGFLYYGVILLSAAVLDEDDSCNFDYPILFFASCSEIFMNMVMRSYVQRVEKRMSLATNFCAAGFAILMLTMNDRMLWLLFFSFVARGTAYAASSFAWVVT